MTLSSGLTLDTGALIAIERRVRRVASLIESARMRGGRITVCAAVIVEWWRGQRGPAARLLEAFDIEPLGADLARLAGQALALSPAGPSPVDAVVMASAARRGDVVLTSDIEDLEALRVAFPGVRVLSV
jgi:predicted nucleic acid-binding protein